MDPVLYQRCLTAVWRSRKSAISRTDLQQAAGLVFQAREEQAARFRMLGVLSARISDLRLSERRVQQIREQRGELERIYEATWLELENAIGSKAAEGIRKNVEETTEADAVQLELPLEKKRTFDLEGEARCNQ